MPVRGKTQTLDDRGDAPASAAAPYVRSEHAINWGSRDPFGGTWQYDENGYPIGPGGFRYTGAQHEFSGGVGQENVARINGAQGGPSYAQWIEEVRRIQGEKARQATAASQARAAQYGNPAERPGANPGAVAWLNAHPNNGPPPVAGPPDPPPWTPPPPPIPPVDPPPWTPPPTPTPDPGPLADGKRHFGGAMPPTAVNDPFAVPSPGAVPVNSAPAPASSPAAAAAPPAQPAPAATAPVPSPFGVTPRPLQPSQALTTTAGATGTGARPATPAPAQPFTMSKPVATTQKFGMDAMKAAGTKPPSPMPTFSRTRSPFDIPGMR